MQNVILQNNKIDDAPSFVCNFYEKKCHPHFVASLWKSVSKSQCFQLQKLYSGNCIKIQCILTKIEPHVAQIVVSWNTTSNFEKNLISDFDKDFPKSYYF